ncbi:hypothetical protein OCF66_24300, partial [Bacillus toyonensis]|uniref:hypothetical protein n=1 Tax=Bacillus toyonensis TaxID=155322 RepID=UPI0021D031B9
IILTFTKFISIKRMSRNSDITAKDRKRCGEKRLCIGFFKILFGSGCLLQKRKYFNWFCSYWKWIVSLGCKSV